LDSSSRGIGWRFNFCAEGSEDPLKYFFFVFLTMCAGDMSRDIRQHESPRGGISPSIVT
jgi:hypothetical protein